MRSRSTGSRCAAAALASVVVAAACGGGSSAPTAPAPAPSLPPTSACGTINGANPGARIVNGVECRAGASPVVLVNVRDRLGVPLGACSGTVIAARAVLTGAHCLDGDVAAARVWLGTGPEILAESFAYFPNYSQNNSATPDVGIIRVGQDLGVAPVPLLTSRDARPGETAVIAGWGRDQNTIGATLRAGTAVITAVGPLLLETAFTTSASSICAGDSGGPLLLSEGGTWSLAGVTSAASVATCNTGTNYYVNMRNQAALNFVLGHVPDATRR